MIENFLKS